MEFNITAICSLPTSELLLQLHSSTYLPATGGGFPLHCCKVPTSIWKILAQLGRSAFWTHTEKMRFQCVLVPFHSYYMGNYSDLQSQASTGLQSHFDVFQVYSGQNSRHGIDPQLCSELKMSQTLYNSSPEYVGQLLHSQRLQLCLPFSGDCLKVGAIPPTPLNLPAATVLQSPTLPTLSSNLHDFARR